MDMPNPASVFCEEQGGTVDIRTGADGGQAGICVFPDGSECDEWAYFRDECAPGGASQPVESESMGMPNPASVFCEEQGGTVDIRTGADGGQAGFCVFPDGSECDEWAYFRDECAPAEGAPGSYTPDPSALKAFQYEDWQVYENRAYGFTLRFPPDWRVEEVTDSGDTMVQHRVSISDPADPMAELHIAFRGASEERQITPTGMGAGDLVARGSVPFLGENLERHALVAEGKVVGVIYGGGGEIPRGDLVFWIAVNYAGSPVADPGLSASVEELADQIVASAAVKR